MSERVSSERHDRLIFAHEQNALRNYVYQTK